MTSVNEENDIGEIVLVNIKEEPVDPDEMPQGDPSVCAEQTSIAKYESEEEQSPISTASTPVRGSTALDAPAVHEEEMIIKVDPNIVDQEMIADGLPDGQATSSGSSEILPNPTADDPGSAKSDRKLTCVVCNHRAVYRSQLVTHMRIHTGERPFACDKCDYRAARLSVLKAHTRIHTSESYTCDKCDYRTGYFNKMQIHKSIHSDETLYICDTCDYRTKFVAHLNEHMRTHTGEKPFACDTCDYRARQLGTLKSHMRTHTGEKPFVCDKCDYQTAHPSALRRHKKAHKVVPDRFLLLSSKNKMRSRANYNVRIKLKIKGKEVPAELIILLLPRPFGQQPLCLGLT